MGNLSQKADKDLRETCACLKSLTWESEIWDFEILGGPGRTKGLGEAK